MKAPIPEKATGELKMTLFDLNKQIMSQKPDLTEDQIIEGKKEIMHFKLDNADSRYFMLLSNDIHYYTVLAIDKAAKELLEDVVIELLHDWGDIKDIYLSENKGSIDFWVKSFNDNMAYFKLFPYDTGVIECL